MLNAKRFRKRISSGVGTGDQTGEARRREADLHWQPAAPFFSQRSGRLSMAVSTDPVKAGSLIDFRFSLNNLVRQLFRFCIFQPDGK